MAVTNGIPKIGFGTSDRSGDAGMQAILSALEIGYRHIDTAQTYESEAETGEALRRSGVPRADVFITTKITGQYLTGGKLVDSLKRSNDAIGVDAVDVTLIHWPVSPRGGLPMPTYLPELAEARNLGLTRLIGVSNFTIADLAQAEDILGPGQIATNQFERHPLLQNQGLVDECMRRNIAVTCYLPLARGRCAGVPAIEAIAKAHGATPHQIALAFSMNEGHVVIPTSSQRAHIAENWAARDIALSAAELDAIRAVDRNERQINPSWSPTWD